MTEPPVLVFLCGLAALLAAGRLLGELGQAARLPLVAGEVAAGLLLGKTGLARALPRAHAWLFPQGTVEGMVGAYAALGALLLVAVVGLQVDVSIVRGRCWISACTSPTWGSW
jgi:Kef-type K+ transport system membrane component KefB